MVVSDRDIDGITLVMIPGVTIGLRIRTDGSVLSKVDMDRVRAGLTWVGARAPFEVHPPQAIESNGTFMMRRLPPGPYKLSVSPLSPDYYIKGVWLGQTDVLGQTIQITGPVAGVLDVLISDKSAMIEGTVVDGRRQPIANIETVLIPDARDRVDLYKRAFTDNNGRFSIRGIPPGNYRLFAWENIEPFAYFDAQVVRQAEAQGKAIRVGELSREVSDKPTSPNTNGRLHLTGRGNARKTADNHNKPRTEAVVPSTAGPHLLRLFQSFDIGQIFVPANRALVLDQRFFPKKVHFQRS